MTTPSFDGPQITASASFSSSYAPQTVALGNGGFAVVWEGFLPASQDPDQALTILARVFNADRSFASDVFAVPQDLAGQQSGFHATATSDGGFAVGYFRSYPFGDRPGEAEFGLARFDDGGTRLVDDGIINADHVFGFEPSPGLVGVEGGPDGSVALLYVDWNSTGVTQEQFNSGTQRVAAHVATIFDAANAVALDGAVIDDGASSIGGEDILMSLDDGRFAFVEIGTGARVGVRFSTDVDLHVFDAAGAVESVSIFDDSLDFQRGSNAPTVLSDGRVVIVTSETESATGRRTPTVTLYDAQGDEISAVTLPQQGSSFSSATIAEDPAGGFYFLFTGGDFNGPERSEAHGFKFDDAGALVGGRFTINRDSSGEQSRPSGAVIDDGDLIVAFHDAPSPFTASTIEIQGFDPAGDTAGATPTDITLTADPLVPGEPGGVIGTLSTTDADAGDVHSYEVVGSTIFEIDGDVLRIPERFTPQDTATFNQVTIRVTDSQFNTFDKLIEIPFEGGGGGGTGGGAKTPVVFRGGGGRDFKNGKATDDDMAGRGGRDVLNGKGGRDTLDGGRGADTLDGGNGNDLITGGRGRDKLTGGKGKDDFIFGPKDGFDVITDFEVNRDDLVFNGGPTRFRDLDITQRGDDLFIKAGRVKVLLEDVDQGDFDRGDVIFG